MFKKLLILLLLCITSALHAANYLTFTAEADNSAFGIKNEGGNDPQIEYSLNKGKSWKSLKADTLISLRRKGKKALLRSMNPEGFSRKGRTKETAYTYFVMTGSIAASGSVMSLLDGKGETTAIPSMYCFFRLFHRCKSLTQAPELPATTLKGLCYCEMFKGCTSLTQAPQLPAQKLEIRCYREMFLGDSSLTQAPQLPATSLALFCYENMFGGCTDLTQAPELPATALEDYCYVGMFSGCTSLTQAPQLPATQLASSCYEGMFRECTSLTQAPELPATTLAEDCYKSMFKFCSSLRQAPQLPATSLTKGCYDNMFGGCKSLTQAPELPATSLAERCYAEMFWECTSLTQAPHLHTNPLKVYHERTSVNSADLDHVQFPGVEMKAPSPTLNETISKDGKWSSKFKGQSANIPSPSFSDNKPHKKRPSHPIGVCSHLEQRKPEINIKRPTPTSEKGCYYRMFSGCTSLTNVRVSFTEWEDDATTEWLYTVAPTGTFICPKELPKEFGASRIPPRWKVIEN